MSVRVCPSCGEENSERARFCQACAKPLPETADAGSEVRKVVTIVFADMAGSTAIGERLDPEALRRVQARYFDAMTAVLEGHGGTVEKYIGDAVMAVFGIPLLHEDDAVRAVRAAQGMQEALAVLNVELERDHGVQIAIRIGVNTGEVVAGDPRAGQRLVTGDAVNVAARLEQAAEAGQVLLGATTQRLVKDAVRVEEVDALDLKGKSGPVKGFRLLEVLPDTAGHMRNLDSPMVGRAKELDVLRRALERARGDRTSQLFTLLGPAGIGKSRLVGEFLAGAADATVLRGRCLSYGDSITYHALREIVQQAAGISESDDAPTAMTRLTAVLAGAEEGDRIAQLAGGLLGWADPSSTEDGSYAVRKAFEHLARERPLIVVFDDIHWAEPLLLDLIEQLADWIRDAELLIVCVARPELLEIRPGWGGGKMNATVILLEPLAGDDAGALLDNILGQAALPPIARDRILAAAEGNPLFVEEMIGMLVDDGLLRLTDGAWRAVSDLANLTVPPTIQLLLAARLDRLESEERAVMERGAVEGKVFHIGAVTSLSPEAVRSQVRPRLLALARKELIRPDRAEFAGQDAFRFRHLLIRDAAYQAMPKEQRAELHEGFARWLTGAAGDRVVEYQEILGYHLEQAYRYRTELGPIDDPTRALGQEAGRALQESSERAAARGDVTSAVHLLERAGEMLEGIDRAKALVDLASLLVGSSDMAPAIAVLDRFLASPEAAEAPGLRIRASVYRVIAQSGTDPDLDFEAARASFASSLAEAEALGDEDAITTCLLRLAQFEFFLGQCRVQREMCERLVPRIGRMSMEERVLVVWGFNSDAYWGSQPVADGMRSVDTIRSILGDGVVGRQKADELIGWLSAMSDRGADFDAALDRVDRAWADLGDPDARFWAGGQQRSESLWRLGRPTEAIDWLRGDKRYLDARGETAFNSTVTALLATYLAESGKLDDAASLIPDARAMAASDDFATHVLVGWAQALVLSAGGDHETALAAIDESLRRILPTDYLTITADTIRIRGRVLLAAGRRAEAEAAFDEALGLFERKGNVASMRRLRSWLDSSAVSVA
jgi:class 3 adenylate cyclase/tetratricopeptide (TPR) repeat protein